MRGAMLDVWAPQEPKDSPEPQNQEVQTHCNGAKTKHLRVPVKAAGVGGGAQRFPGSKDFP